MPPTTTGSLRGRRTYALARVLVLENLSARSRRRAREGAKHCLSKSTWLQFTKEGENLVGRPGDGRDAATHGCAVTRTGGLPS